MFISPFFVVRVSWIHGMEMMEKAFFFFFFDTSTKSYEIAGRVGRPAGGWFLWASFSLSLYREYGERERESRFTFLHVFLGVPSLVFSWRGGGVNGNERVKWTYLSVIQSVSRSIKPTSNGSRRCSLGVSGESGEQSGRQSKEKLLR